jgi:hypothetical protein
MRKSSKSQADEPLTWRARISVNQNGMGDRLTERSSPLLERENL